MVDSQIDNIFVFHTNELKANFEDDTVEGYIATPDPDTYRDIVTEKCMIDLVRQINSGNIKLDHEHENFRTGNPLDMAKNSTGKILSAKLDNTGVYVKAVLNKSHQRYAEIKSSIKNGFLDAFSIAYVPIDFAYRNVDGVRHRLLDRVLLKNVAFTGIPVNSHATIEKVMLKSIQQGELLMAAVEAKAEEKKEDKKEETEEEKKKREEKEKADKTETKATEAKVEVKSEVKENVELKSLVEQLKAVQAELVEMKSKKVESKEAEFEVKLKSLEAQFQKIDEVMSKPQLKAVVQNAESTLAAETAKAVETKSRGIVARL